MRYEGLSKDELALVGKDRNITEMWIADTMRKNLLDQAQGLTRKIRNLRRQHNRNIRKGNDLGLVKGDLAEGEGEGQ